jgi:hypothetical protein
MAEYNKICGICQSALTSENTKPGFGVCCWRSVGPTKPLTHPDFHIQHQLVCVHCEPRAKEVNEGFGLFVYDVDGPSLRDVVRNNVLVQVGESA